MDLRVSPRGRFEIDPQTGGFSVVTDISENLSQYLRAAITDQLSSDTFPSIRAADIGKASKLAEFKLEAQRRIIQLVLNSPFAYDFNEDSIQVEATRSQTDAVLVSIRYLGGTSSEILTNYAVDGGRLVLDEELDSPYIMIAEERLIEEEIVVTDQVEELDVSCEPNGPLYICAVGTNPQVENLTINFKDIPDIERRVAKNVGIDGNTYPSLGSKSSYIVHLGSSGIDNPLVQGVYDSILISTLIKNRGINFKITDIQPVSGDIRYIRYIPEIEDWLIETINEGQDSITVAVSSIQVVETADRFFYRDAKAVTQVDRYPFPNEAVRGRKFYILDNILNPGTYTCYYKGLVKPRYNGSLEEV